ncbi:DUF6603 domain-containing protein [Streptomyces sichuanensis]|uniref:DUF6603 domain-containing protein n=1 Tax=Streptomyces sichuanensis TaxID=2871810 RepID=UPI0027E148AD|nr:DUF6603 domain-containing protein [Streptomyces sichuanensis]
MLALAAELTPESYVLEPECRLTGGLAYRTWFGGSHEGDFVFCLGGYAPGFDRPDHYPDVPRLGYTWGISDCVTVRGEAVALEAGTGVVVEKEKPSAETTQRSSPSARRRALTACSSGRTPVSGAMSPSPWAPDPPTSATTPAAPSSRRTTSGNGGSNWTWTPRGRRC